MNALADERIQPLRIVVVTMARSEAGSFLPVLRLLQQDPSFDLRVVVAGSHLSTQFGSTGDLLEQSGVKIAERLETQLDSFTGPGIAKSIGLGTIALADCFSRLQPDLVFIIGDRWELLSVTSAATAARIPVVHHSGGDLTEGAIDNQVRFAVSQMSHLHFVAMQQHADRLLQTGEEPWRVHISGEPALDELQEIDFMPADEIAASLGIEFRSPLILTTYHPTTLGDHSAAHEADVFLKALENIDGTLIISAPNPDMGRDVLAQRLVRFAQQRPGAVFVPSLGQRRYYSLMRIADLMLGNSSSGIWESPSFKLPVVNIGARQQGRVRAGNVIDCDLHHDDILRSVNRALDPAFRQSLHNVVNPYGAGDAAVKIVQTLKTLPSRDKLLQKQFIDHFKTQNAAAPSAFDRASA